MFDPMDHVESLIGAHGLAVVNIMPDQIRGLPWMNYSVGLQDYGLPELVLTGVPAPIAVPVINEIASWLKAKGSAPSRAEELPDGILATGRARFRQLSRAEIEANLLFAVHRSDQIGRDPPDAFQIIYQDEQGRWPEEAGYSCALALLLAQDGKETRQ